MARKLKSINAYNTITDLWDILEKSYTLSKAFGITSYTSLTPGLPADDYSSYGFQRLFLLSGYYGDFPPITVPNENGYMWKWGTTAKEKLNAKADIDSILELVASTIPDIAPTKGYEHEDLYRVAHFCYLYS